MSWLHYLIEANIYLGVFYLCYCLFLIRDTHYMLNRVYLIFSCVIAFILPVTQLSILKPVMPGIRIEEPVPAVSFNPVRVQPITIAEPVRHITFDDVLIYLYIAGVVIAFCVLIFRLRKLYILTRKSQSLYNEQYKLVKLNDENTAFSFFNYLFIGSKVPQPETIIAHELVHIRQKHSADIIFMEVVKIVNWFNPFIYLIQRSLKTIHEYIADEQTAAKEHDTLAYSSFLLNNAYGIQGNSIAHSFFNYNLLKKRIIMLNKNRSGKLARLKYLAALPLCAGMLCTSTLVFSKDYGFIDLAPRKAIKQVTDSTKYMLQMVDKKNNFKTTFSDMVIKDPKTGVEKKYNVNTFTKADQANLLKRGLIVQRIVIDSSNYTLQLTAPDGTKGRADAVMIDDTKTGFKHSYSVNIPITESEQIDLEARGYRLAVIERPKEWADTGKRLQPPPPPPLQKRTPPAQPKKLKDQVKLPPSPPAVEGVRIPEPVPAKGLRKMPPPPPPVAPKPPKLVSLTADQKAGMAFNHAIAKNISYPKASRENSVAGRVIASFTVNDGKISDVKIVRGIDENADAEIKRVLENYSGSAKLNSASYSLPVLFALVNEKNEVVKKTALSPTEIKQLPPPPSSGIRYVLNEIVVTAYAPK